LFNYTYLEQVKNTLTMIEESELIDFHKEIANRQRNAYNRMRTDINFLKDNLLIEIDYKQKIILGKSPRQRSMDFYDENMPQRSFLGLGIYYIEKLDGDETIKCLNMDLVFHHSAQTCVETIKGIEFARIQEVFRKIDKKYWTIWTDCGNHFR